MGLLAALFAVVIGVLVAVQPAINARLKNFAGDPAYAALISTLTSSTVLLLYVLLLRHPRPSLAKLSLGPWWIWTGGILGAIYVAVSLNLTQRLGTAVLLALVVVGQMVGALVVDHYGLFGVAERPVTLFRLAGVLLLIAGVALIRWF